jgi:hypothetical protein
LYHPDPVESGRTLGRQTVREPSGRSYAWIFFVGALALSCGPAGQTSARRSSASSAEGAAQPAGSPAPTGPKPTGPTRWERAGELSTLRKAGPRSPSSHLTGDLEGEVLINEAAQGYTSLGPNRRMPAGALVVQALGRPGDGEVQALFAMSKLPDGWDFLILQPNGDVVKRGDPLCRRCHAEAPHDFLFGAPRR